MSCRVEQKPHACTARPLTGATPDRRSQPTTPSQLDAADACNLGLTLRASSKEPINAPLALHTCARTLTPAANSSRLTAIPKPPAEAGSKRGAESPTCQANVSADKALHGPTTP